MKVSTIRNFLSHRINIAILVLLILVIVSRLIYINANYAVWWDEAEYLLLGKSFIEHTPITAWTSSRGILLPLGISLLSFLGSYETAGKIIEIISTVGVVFFTYLIGSKMYNRYVGFSAAVFTAFMWETFFISTRILTELPSAFTVTASFYFAFSYFQSKEKKYLVLTSLFSVLAIMLRYDNALILLPTFFMILSVKNMKDIVTYVLTTAISLVPLAIFNFLMYGSVFEPISKLLSLSGVLLNVSGAQYTLSNYAVSFVNLFQWPLFILFALGALYLLLKIRSYKSTILTIAILVFVIPFHRGIVDGRFLIRIEPLMLIVAACGLYFILFKFLSNLKIDSRILIGSIVLLVLAISFFNMQLGISIIESKTMTYAELKDAGAFLGATTSKDSLVITDAPPFVNYYANRRTILFPETEQEFFSLLKRDDTESLLLSLYERRPDYVSNKISNYTFLSVTNAFTKYDPKQPLVYTFKINKTALNG